MERIIDVDPITGITTTFEYNAVGDETKIGMVFANNDHIIESNKWALGDLDKHKKQSKDGWAHYAKVPFDVIEKWKREEGINFWDANDWKRVMKKLNDPDYRYLKRTTYKHDR